MHASLFLSTAKSNLDAVLVTSISPGGFTFLSSVSYISPNIVIVCFKLIDAYMSAFHYFLGDILKKTFSGHSCLCLDSCW